jgi:uncharacterized protein
MEDERPALLFAGRAPIGGYGKGMFRTGGIQHRGSLLILPEGTFAWPVTSAAALSLDSFAQVLSTPSAGFLLLGTGAQQVFPDRALRDAFARVGLGLEAMDTGAACRTYNVLLAEERVFAAALIALSD